jgi:hypothetical protein
MVVGQRRGKQVGVAAEQRRFVFGDDPLHPIHVDRLKIGEVADHLLGGPLAGDRPGVKLFGGHPGDGGTEPLRTAKVVVDQLGVVHVVLSNDHPTWRQQKKACGRSPQVLLYQASARDRT